MTILSEIADGYGSGKYEWIQGSYGDSTMVIAENPNRTPQFCPSGAVAVLSDTRYNRIVAQRSLRDVVRELGYTSFIKYNDEEGRTLSEVLDTMRAADRYLISHPDQVVHSSPPTGWFRTD